MYYIRINYALHKNQSVLHENGQESIMYYIRNELLLFIQDSTVQEKNAR